VNAIAILSEDRFLARGTRPLPPSPAVAQLTCAVGWSNSVPDASFGASAGDASVKSKLINLMTSVRTLMRSMSPKAPRFMRGGWELTVIVPLIAINTVIIVYELALG
jgi:immediate early response 3-interacting protein 1